LAIKSMPTVGSAETNRTLSSTKKVKVITFVLLAAAYSTGPRFSSNSCLVLFL